MGFSTSGELMMLVTSNRPRPSVHKTGKGHQWWKRDVFHIQAMGETLCGVPTADWLKMDAMPTVAALAHTDLCSRCAAKFKNLVAAEKIKAAMPEAMQHAFQSRR